MGAIIVISYLVICLVVASFLTAFMAMFRRVSSHDNFMSWRWTIGFGVFLAVAPYVYMKVLTDRYKLDIDDQVHHLISDIGIKGDLAYFVVTNADDTHMRVLAVANERTTIRFNDRVIVEINMVPDKHGKWGIYDYEVLTSFERQKDKIVLPPLF